jgi:hypothetical protein
MDYFISDPHFGHKRIIKFERTEFNNIKEHDEYLINSINKTVKVTDTLYILGDVFNVENVRFLNGRKILLKGNHDNRSNKEYLGYFAKVHDNPFYYNSRILLSHYPHPVEDHILNVHGHLHNAVVSKENYLNLSAKMIDYKPVSEKELITKLNKLPEEKRDFLDEWYAPYYKFKENIDGVILDENNILKVEETKEYRRKLFS